MTADQRLDQLEPILSEAITVLDRHTFQLKQLGTAVGSLIELMTKQSDNIAFLLQENIAIKDRLTKLEGDVATLKSDVAEIKEKQNSIDSKLDLILAKLK